MILMVEEVENKDESEITLSISFSFYVFNYQVFWDYLFTSE